MTRTVATEEDTSLYHKNLQPVTYVTGDVAGVVESPVYAILQMNRALASLRAPEGYGVEILNTRAVGPNLELAPESNPFDGVLTVVTAREQDRGALADYIAGRLRGLDTRLALEEQSARCIDIDCAPTLHVDDELLRLDADAGVSIRVQPAAVTVLVSRP